MKKLFILIMVLALAIALNIAKLDKGEKLLDTVVLNMDIFPDFAVRNQMKACLEGSDGSFSSPFEITLYTGKKTIPQYRYIKERIELWGGKCTLKKASEESIFDFRALGALPLYIWTFREDDLYEAFLSKNSSFYSTGFESLEYDEAVSNALFGLADEILYENICLIKN